MTEALPVLNANPLALVRSLPTELVPLDQLKVPEGMPMAEAAPLLAWRGVLNQEAVRLAAFQPATRP